MILINWCLQTDGDFNINNMDDYGCVQKGFEKYIGFKEFDNKKEAKLFLDGMRNDLLADSDVSNDFNVMISSIKSFINGNDHGGESAYMHGNYNGTYITVIILENK